MFPAKAGLTIKEGENIALTLHFVQPPRTILRTYGAGRHTLSIPRIYPPPNFGGLKFEPVEAKRRSRPSGTQRLGKRGCFSKVSI